MRYIVIGLACLFSACYGFGYGDWSEITPDQAKEITAKADEDARLSKVWNKEIKQTFFIIRLNAKEGKIKSLSVIETALCTKMVVRLTTLGYQIDEVSNDSSGENCYIDFSW